MSLLAATTVRVLDRAASYDLTSLETAREELGVSESKLSDAKLKRWITQESNVIARTVKRTLAQERVSQVFVPALYGSHGAPLSLDVLRLQRYPVREIESVTINDEDVLTEEDWAVDAEAGLIYRIVPPWCGSVIEIVYTGGYMLPGSAPGPEGLPPIYEKACLAQLRHRRATSGRDPSVRSETVDTFSTTYWVGAIGENAALVPEAYSLLINEIERSI